MEHTLHEGRRLELVDLLAQGPRTVEALAEETDQSVANTSQHLQVLRQARLVETSRRGNYVHYRLADDHVLRLWAALHKAGEVRLAEIRSLVIRVQISRLTTFLTLKTLPIGPRPSDWLRRFCHSAVRVIGSHTPGINVASLDRFAAVQLRLPRDFKLLRIVMHSG
jgi:DNA-binding transcriptional ArsR family regulator